MMKSRKTLKNPGAGGTYAQIFMKFRTLYFSMFLKEQKNFRSGGTYAQIFINVRALGIFVHFFLPNFRILQAILDIKLTDTARVAPHGAACAILFKVLLVSIMHDFANFYRQS